MKPEQEKLEQSLQIRKFRREGHADVLAGKTKSDLSRRKILDDLARAEYAEGLYDQVPDDFSPGQ